MKYSTDPLFGPETGKHNRMIRKIRAGKIPEKLYALVLPDDRNVLELFPPMLLKQKYFKEYPGTVVGFVSSAEEGEEFMASLLTTAYRNETLGDLKKLFPEEKT
ncbi:MAG: hypothetical protein IKY02_04495 [Lachnospiraceae bacterium]|nr:hypothetical protein [Lachnospiraceae bacterium]